MSEKMSSQSEDPLPLGSGITVPSYLYDKEPRGTLGELVVTDPLDPFVWLSKIPRPSLSEKAKQVLWAIYRLSGHFPDGSQVGKLRDEMIAEDLFEGLSEIDIAYIESYGKYLRYASMSQHAITKAVR